MRQLPAIKFDNETKTRLNRVVSKIIKGLYYFHFNKFIKNTVNININFYDEIDNITKNSLKLLKHNTIGNDKIRYWFDEASDREFSSIWVILFYNSIISIVITNDTSLQSALL